MSYFDDNEDRIVYGGRYRHHSEAPQEPRWRQQGGRWVLFSLRPGIEHLCDGFEALE